MDSNIPMPRVSAYCEQDAPLAAAAEAVLRTKTDQLPFEEFNDMDERNCYNQGGSWALIEWDAGSRHHGGVGDLKITGLHPLQVIPQEGVCEVDDMDFIFVRLSATREAVKARWGQDVADEYGEGPEPGAQQPAGGVSPPDTVTVNIAYYKNGRGGIGRYSWAGATELEHLEDCETPRLRKCAACGEGVTAGETSCPACGKSRLVWQEQAYEEVELPLRRSDGSEIPAQEPLRDEFGQPVLNPDGSMQLDELGRPVELPVMRRVRVPVYRPRCFPVVLRRNVSRYGTLLGSSDIDVIRPQQDTIKKLGSSILEKLLKGGSYVTLPAGVKVETSDRQLKILRIDNPAQKALIDVLNIQPNISLDMAAMNDQYEKARSALGITSSFQGKPDRTAQSGIAKQFAAAQSAGRLESKRRMKDAYYQRIYRLMFRYLLAYSDGPVCYCTRDDKGNELFCEFNRYDYLKQDEAGEWYWDDEFQFSVDTTGGLAQNREGMWMEAEKKYTSGAMGNPAEDATRVLYWTLLEQLQFPLAKAVKRALTGGREEAPAQPAGGLPPPGGPEGGPDLSGLLALLGGA